MSRVGKNPVEVPAGVDCSITEGQIRAKGKLGELNFSLSSQVKVSLENGKVYVKPLSDEKISRMMWGTTRRLVHNLFEGVNKGFSERMEINGVGYRAEVQGKNLVMQLGFSHEVRYPIPEGITIVCEKPTLLVISGRDRQKVGQIAAEIREYRKPEPYKGKGIKYENEKIFRKEGKKK